MDSYVLLTFLLLSQIAQQGATQTPVVEADLGAEVTLICPSRGDSLQWNGPNSVIYTIGDKINPSLEIRNRLSVIGDHANGEYNLRISNITLADNGGYSCNVDNMQHNLRLRITDKVEADVDEKVCISFQFDIEIGLNTTFIRFNASTTNTLVVKIIDLSRSVIIIDNRFVYTKNSIDKVIGFCIRNLTRNDTGIYYVEHQDLIYKANLTVFLPLESVEMSYSNGTIAEGHISVFRCEAMSYPVASVAWIMDSKPLSLPVSLIVNGDNVKSILQYTADRKDHKKTVRCDATNNRTSVMSENVILNVLFSPEVVIKASTDPLVQVVGQKNLQFTCSDVHSNPSIISYQWFFEHTLLRNETKNILSVYTVTSDHNGTFSCKGVNGIGDGMKANTRLYVLGIPTPTVSDMICNTSSTVTIVCSLEGYEDFYSPTDWRHTNGDIEVRTLQGTVANGVMSLTIEFCDYQDIGTYMCLWKGGKDGLGVLNNTGSLQVKGAPVIADSKVLATMKGYLISVYFYSDPYPFDPVWVHDNTPLVYGSDYHKSTGRGTIGLTSYGKKVKVSGFITNLTILDKDIVGKTFTYRLGNSFGSISKSIKISASEPDDARLTTGAIAGIAIGSVCIAALVTIIIVFLLYFKRKIRLNGKKGKDVVGKVNEGTEQYDMVGSPDPPTVYEQLNSPSSIYNDIEN